MLLKEKHQHRHQKKKGNLGGARRSKGIRRFGPIRITKKVEYHKRVGGKNYHLEGAEEFCWGIGDRGKRAGGIRKNKISQKKPLKKKDIDGKEPTNGVGGLAWRAYLGKKLLGKGGKKRETE